MTSRRIEASPLLAAAADRSRARGQGFGEQIACWATAILNNGLGEYGKALAAVEDAVELDEIDGFSAFHGCSPSSSKRVSALDGMLMPARQLTTACRLSPLRTPTWGPVWWHVRAV